MIYFIRSVISDLNSTLIHAKHHAYKSWSEMVTHELVLKVTTLVTLYESQFPSVHH